MVTLSDTEGGVWHDAAPRALDGQPADLYPSGSVGHQGSLADILNQHNQLQHLA